MDFPVFHLDLLGNRALIAVIATVHVLINHMLAVGLAPLVVFLEWLGIRTGDDQWDRLAYRILFVGFIVTTSLGALTGVGIWLSTSLVNPQAIGSLIRVFFWAWFTEWIVFVAEVALILAYTLSWRTVWARTHKRAHLGLGVALVVVSWLTMAVVVAILGFQMDTGVWTVQPGFWTAVLNPLYLPQLFFRTPFALVTAGMFGLFLTYVFTDRGSDFRARAVRAICGWTLAFAAAWLVGAVSYWRAIPERMFVNLPTAMTTLGYQNFLDPLRWLVGLSVAALVLVCVWGLAAPRRLPMLIGVVPVVLAVWQLAYFERVREFIRKPDVIASYMYSNGLRAQDYPLYAQDGLLAHATYSPVREATDVGREMFRLACSRCHTTAGINGVVQKFTAMYGAQPWDAKVMRTYLDGMHNARPFMPPVPGTAGEKDALAAFVVALQQDRQPLSGAQTSGVASATPLPLPRDIPLPLPADSVLLQTLLVMLFLWHILFVNLMVGGSLLTLAFEVIGRRRPGYDALAKEIAGTLTVNKSLAVVLGVGPLLTINLLYALHFYSANALTGAAWISIVPLVTVAFLVTYLHKYTWDRIPKTWHLALAALGAALFLVIPLIFFANINLMLFPAKWLEVRGFASAFALANAGPRYWHFLTASVAVSALFLLIYFLRAGYPVDKKIPEMTRSDLRRLFYGIALGATCAQLFFGLLVLVTLPKIGLSATLYVVIGSGAALATAAAVLMGREVVRPADRALPRVVAVFALITLTAFAMGYGRHIYRENALREHRRLVATHTADVGWMAAAAQWREATSQGLAAVPLGRKIFESTCAACHAKDRVLVGPSLQEIAGLYAGNPEGIAVWTDNPGKKRVGFQQMPAFKLGNEKLKAVAEYVLELGGAPAAAGG